MSGNSKTTPYTSHVPWRPFWGHYYKVSPDLLAHDTHTQLPVWPCYIRDLWGLWCKFIFLWKGVMSFRAISGFLDTQHSLLTGSESQEVESTEYSQLSLNLHGGNPTNSEILLSLFAAKNSDPTGAFPGGFPLWAWLSPCPLKKGTKSVTTQGRTSGFLACF